MDDIVQSYSEFGGQSKRAWINNGNGWTLSSTYNPPALISGRDGSTPNGWSYGTHFVDLNGDKRIDMVQAHYNFGGQTKGAWINTNGGWVYDYNYVPSVLIAGRDYGSPNGWDYGTRYLDLDGDSIFDLVYGFNNYGGQMKQSFLNQEKNVGLKCIKRASVNNPALVTITYQSSLLSEGAVTSSYNSYPYISNVSTRMLVTNISSDNGLGETSSISYEYYNGRFKTGLPHERKTLGFEWIKKTDDATGNYRLTTYLQDEDFAYLTNKETIYDSFDNLHNKSQYFYSSRNDNGKPSEVKFVYLTDNYRLGRIFLLKAIELLIIHFQVIM